jgi:hypothetical protein
MVASIYTVYMNSENQNNILENKLNFKCRNDCDKCQSWFSQEYWKWVSRPGCICYFSRNIIDKKMFSLNWYCIKRNGLVSEGMD